MALPLVTGTGFIIGEVKQGFSNNGNAWVAFPLAMNRPEKNDDGSYVKTEDLKKKIVLNVMASGKTAESLMEVIQTKTELTVSGEIYTDVFTKDDGTQIVKTAMDLRTFGIPFQRNNDSKGGGKKAAAKKNDDPWG